MVTTGQAGDGRTDCVEVRLEVNSGRLPVRLEALDDHLLDVHGDVVVCSEALSLGEKDGDGGAKNPSCLLRTPRVSLSGVSLARMTPVQHEEQLFTEGGDEFTHSHPQNVLDSNAHCCHK